MLLNANQVESADADDEQIETAVRNASADPAW